LTEHRVAVSYETVRRWANHFRPTIVADPGRRRLKPDTTWHLDEVYLKSDGGIVYLWRAIDAEGKSSMYGSSPSETSQPRCN
jgi:putative transposase